MAVPVVAPQTSQTPGPNPMNLVARCALALLLTASGAWSQQYYVSPFGDDATGDGSADLPWRSVTKAMQAATVGDQINVGAGSYDAFHGEAFPLVVKDGVSLVGPGPGLGTATLNGANVFVPLLVVTDNVEPTVIQFLRMDGEVNIIEVSGNPTDLTVADCVFLGGQKALNHEAAGDEAALQFLRNTAVNMDVDGLTWVATGGANLEHRLIIRDNHFVGASESGNGVRIGAVGDVTVNLTLRNNYVENFSVGYDLAATASGSTASLTGVIRGNEAYKCNGDGVSCTLTASGLGPSVAAFDASFFQNAFARNDGDGMEVYSSALGPDNSTEFHSSLWANEFRRNEKNGVYIREFGVAGGVCDTQPDFGGGPWGSWGGNTFERNDEEYVTGAHYDMRLESATNVFAQNNWWGELDLLLADSIIESHIFHQVDDPLAGLVDFSRRRPDLLTFAPTQNRTKVHTQESITLLAEADTVFVERAGSTPLSVTVGEVLSPLVTVAPNGQSLTFKMPDLRATGGGTLPIEITDPNGRNGLSSIIVQGDGNGDGFCFVATATYNHPDAPEALTLRRWRDHYLADHAAGRAFIRTYYHHSPRLAGWIAENPRWRGLSRAALAPVVWSVRIWMDHIWFYWLILPLLFARKPLRKLIRLNRSPQTSS